MAYKTMRLCILQMRKHVPVRFILFSVGSTWLPKYSWVRKTALWTCSTYRSLSYQLDHTLLITKHFLFTWANCVYSCVIVRFVVNKTWRQVVIPCMSPMLQVCYWWQVIRYTVYLYPCFYSNSWGKAWVQYTTGCCKDVTSVVWAYVQVFVGCCLVTQILNLNNTKWNGWRW